MDAPKAEETEKKTDDEEATSASEEQSADKKVVKIGALSAEERAKLRAEKFGVPIPDVMKKAVRAERFGLAESKNTTTGNSQVYFSMFSKTKRHSATISIQVDQEKLTKRQARFGIVADETDLKKQKRAERFGAGATKTSAVDDEKLRKRAERFGLS